MAIPAKKIQWIIGQLLDGSILMPNLAQTDHE